MICRKTEKGFTLVELAIVMTIIGLLIGGILKGQELMENARVTATIAQTKSYEAAVTTFRDTFAAIPGDMVNATTRIPNCGSCTNGDGNSIVGTAGGVGTAQADVATSPAAETVFFWTELLLADLISGVSDEALAATPAYAWGETHPAAKIGGGFHAKHGDGTALPGTLTQLQPSGMVLVLRNSPTADLTDTAGQQPLTPLRAAQIDRKMDDGQPGSGFVRGYGVDGTCGTAAGGTYDETATTKDCGLMIRIQA